MFLINWDIFQILGSSFLIVSFLKHATKLKFLQVGNFCNFMLQAFSMVSYLKGLCSFVLCLQLLNAELDFATSV